MTWDTIVAWVIRGIIFLYVVITAIVAVIRKKRSTIEGEETESEMSVFEKIATSAIQFVGEVEKAYNNLVGDSDKKAGPMKLETVLSKLRQLCSDLDVDFDIQYWTDFINKIVDNMNIKRGESIESIQVDSEDNKEMSEKKSEDIVGYAEIVNPITLEKVSVPVRKKFSFEE